MWIVRGALSMVRWVVEHVVSTMAVFVVIVAIVAYFSWIPEGHPVLAGVGFAAIAVAVTVLALRWARRHGRDPKSSA